MRGTITELLVTMKEHDGYGSKDKLSAVKYIANTAVNDCVRNQADKALQGKASLDSALVEAHKTGQDCVRHTANIALGIED